MAEEVITETPEFTIDDLADSFAGLFYTLGEDGERVYDETLEGDRIDSIENVGKKIDELIDLSKTQAVELDKLSKENFDYKEKNNILRMQLLSREPVVTSADTLEDALAEIPEFEGED